jgi:diketogulonate reductase-like aldo/keto reductase
VKQKEFGVKGPEVTIFGQGTWCIDRIDRKSAAAALRRGIELGMTHIDTAEAALTNFDL